MAAPKGTRPPNAGKGRKRGVPNHATANAREAISRLIDGNIHRLQNWLDRIDQEEGPKAAWQCFMSLLEFGVPKLARNELTDAGGGPLGAVHSIIEFVPAPASGAGKPAGQATE